MVDGYDAFPQLRFDRPAAGILRITLDGPGLNAVDAVVHRQLADVWLTVDRDGLKGKVAHIPSREEMQPIVNEQLIVELYSR